MKVCNTYLLETDFSEGSLELFFDLLLVSLDLIELLLLHGGVRLEITSAVQEF